MRSPIIRKPKPLNLHNFIFCSVEIVQDEFKHLAAKGSERERNSRHEIARGHIFYRIMTS